MPKVSFRMASAGRVKLEPRADAVLDERIGEARRDRMRRPPPGAVRRNEVVRVELAQRDARGLDDRLESGAAQVEAAHDRMEVVLARELPNVTQDVDDPRVAAARQNDEALAADGGHERLVVENQGVGLPGSVPVRLVTWKPALEIGSAVDLTGDEQRPVEQERRLLLFDDVEAGPA